MQAARGASLNPSDPADEPVDEVRRATARTRSLVIFASLAACGYAVDVISKVVAVARLTDQPPVPVLGDLLQLTLVRNPGAAFSTGTSYTFLLSLVAVTATIVVLFMARRLRNNMWAVGLGCLLGGVLGNLTDRIFRQPAVLRGHVVDFLALPHWPVFNVADMCINIAAAVIIVQAIRGVSHTGDRKAS